MTKVLVSWFGTADLRAARGQLPKGNGPVAEAIAARHFDRVVLLTNHEKAEVAEFEGWLRKRTDAPITMQPVKLRSPTDYADIYRAVSQTVKALRANLPVKSKLTFHLSPGTPAMATVWILVAPSYGAEVIQSSVEAGVETATIPFDIVAEFAPALVRQGEAELERLSAGAPPEDASFKDILFRSEAMQRLVERATTAARYAAPILIEGESGTGKELLAAAIHGASGRTGPFVPVNCGAIPRELVESTFFGHTRGAFTGATSDRAGVFEGADHGTLFLDEIGELPLDAQVKLLRVIQEKKVQRIGARSEKTVDVRIVAATNRDLHQEVAAGRFREDLYFRLAVLVLRSPPLREREGDVLLLVNRELEKLNEQRPEREKKKLSPGAKTLLLRHPWPGNVRELQATLLRAFVWSKAGTIDEAAVRDALVLGPNAAKGTESPILHRPIGNGFRLEDTLAEVVRHYLSRALEEAHGNKTKAAALAGFASYQTLTNWAKKYGVEV